LPAGVNWALFSPFKETQKSMDQLEIHYRRPVYIRAQHFRSGPQLVILGPRIDRFEI
jgi:hypothetical protein